MGACYVTQAQLTWALTREWALTVRLSKMVTWALTWDTTVVQNRHSFSAIAANQLIVDSGDRSEFFLFVVFNC